MKRLMVMTMAAGLLVGCERASVEQASEDFNQLPVAVQKTIREHKPNAEIASVASRSRDGMAVYEIYFRDKERHPALEVAADGTIVKYERGMARGVGGYNDEPVTRGAGSGGSDLSALPLEVQKAIRANTPPADVVGIHRTEDDGRVIYEIEFSGHDRKPRLRLSQDGTVLPSKEGILDD